MNPSTADGMRDDHTIRKCVGFAMNAGYGGIQVMNLFALRATEPTELRKAEDPVGPRNNEYLAAIPEGVVVAAWGAIPWWGKGKIVERERVVLNMLESRVWHSFGLTSASWPCHPARVPYSANLVPWDWRASLKVRAR